MRTDFLPKLMYGAGDAAAGGAFPWASAAQAVLGLGQTLFSGAHKAQKNLENLQTPTYDANKSIMDYYNAARQRYNVNPYQSQQYQNAVNSSNRVQGNILNSLQGRGGAVAGIGKLAAISNDAALRAGTEAEQEQNQRFNQLGGATQMKTADDLRSFQYNREAPYEKKYNLLALKASGANKTLGAGIQNAFGGLQGIQDSQNLNKMYGEGNQLKTPQYF